MTRTYPVNGSYHYGALTALGFAAQKCHYVYRMGLPGVDGLALFQVWCGLAVKDGEIMGA